MKVSESSWHYWLYEVSFENGKPHGRETNLCPYFWRVVGGASKLLIVIAVLLALLAAIGFGFWKYTAIAFGLVTVISVAIALIDYEREIKNFFTSSGDGTSGDGTEPEPKREPEPGLLRSYLKAKKDKVCPPIEFVE